jgi:hypothetical protein
MVKTMTTVLLLINIILCRIAFATAFYPGIYHETCTRKWLPTTKSISSIQITEGTYDSLYGITMTSPDGTTDIAPYAGCTSSGSYTFDLTPGIYISNVDYWTKDHPVTANRY